MKWQKLSLSLSLSAAQATEGKASQGVPCLNLALSSSARDWPFLLSPAANNVGMMAVERAKAQIRAVVEHPFHVLKNLFHHKKARYKGLAKNEAQLYSLFGLANLVIARAKLLALNAQGGS